MLAHTDEKEEFEEKKLI